MRRFHSLVAVCVLVTLFPACRDVARVLGSGPSGPAAVDDLVVAIATRFGPIQRGPRFNAARPKLARSAFVPSRVFDDASVWTTREGEWRQLDLFGHRDGEKYRLDVHKSAPPPWEPGDYRGRLRLHRLGEGRFEWTLRQELAVGPLRPEDIAGALTLLLQAAEGVSAAEARTLANEAFPRSAAVFSRLFDLETLDLTPQADGGTAIAFGVRLRPERIRPTSPRYAAFLEKHAAPMRMAAIAKDALGATWWTVELEKLLWTFRLRVRDGSLVPLDGPAARRIPDQLRVTMDYSTKVGFFTIGVRDLVADVTLVRRPDEKGYRTHFQQEPEWRLPFIVKPFLRSSLRYPFEGSGSWSSFAVRGSTDGPTKLVRDLGTRVRESWIVKWLGGASNTTLGEFRKGAESESDRYSRECLYALRDDVVTVLNEGPD
jgi:hypothetical protein